MSRTEIVDSLKEILLAADDRNRDKVLSCTESSRLVADLGFSSVSMLYMVIAIEEEMNIRFENVGASDFETLGDVVNYIEAKLK
jgi:acyl carrier protein